MASRRYIPELIYSVAFSSLAVHLLFQRRTAEMQQRQVGAQISILEGLKARFLAGERIPDAQVARLKKLGREGESCREDEDDIGWKEVLFGRQETEMEREGTEKWDRRDLERVQQEIQEHSNAPS
ncbi:hypothetical protein EWM64_g6539 [Hericium alpestre]|uniref:Uncharacterized protein n=1 Tax=Hericium alpestre TaxID=135208 RepID=A0A4Y9ZSC5_9AGAM|nr:hypothetical protein EWM64_g6539 [Hericium alpestre]